MSNPLLGYGGSIGLGIETEWGTAVARTNWLRAFSLSLEKATNWKERDHLGYANGLNMVRRSKFLERVVAGGAIECPFGYDDSSVLLLHHGMGKIATTGGEAPYTHTGSLGMPNEYPVGLTMEQVRGRLGANFQSQVFEGCVFTRYYLRQSYGEILRHGGDLVAEDAAAPGTAGTPDYGSGSRPVLHHQCSKLTWEAIDKRVRSWELTVDHRRGDFRELLGSSLTQRPVPSDVPDVTLTVTVEYDETTAERDHHAGEEGALAISYSGGTGYSLTVAGNMYLSSASQPTQGQGIVEQTLVFRPLAAIADAGVTVAVQNASSSASAN